jgi:mannose-6-phosphate isomerase-like protein (cupin superfamily)
MATAQKEAQVFRYEKPDLDHGKATMWLCRTDILGGYIQVLSEGGENNLHSHPTNDGFWFVLGGRARFYGEGDELLADIGKHEGILIPRGMKYWFESGSDEPLEIMRIGAVVAGTKDVRVDVTPQTEAVTMSKHLAAAAPERAGAATVSRPPDGWER